MMIKENDFTRVKNDVNGNPRYVCHYLNLNTDEEASVIMGWDAQGRLKYDKYALALTRAKTLGGRKFHNKQYGGGIVFQCYNLRDLCERINELTQEVTA
jgi:hypothetical protein